MNLIYFIVGNQEFTQFHLTLRVKKKWLFTVNEGEHDSRFFPDLYYMKCTHNIEIVFFKKPPLAPDSDVILAFVRICISLRRVSVHEYSFSFRLKTDISVYQ